MNKCNKDGDNNNNNSNSA